MRDWPARVGLAYETVEKLQPGQEALCLRQRANIAQVLFAVVVRIEVV